MTFIQIGTRVDGYASSIGRPVVFGKATDEQKELIEVGYKAQAAVADMLKAGVPAADVAKAHIENVKKMGYGDWLLYGPCHRQRSMYQRTITFILKRTIINILLATMNGVILVDIIS